MAVFAAPSTGPVVLTLTVLHKIDTERKWRGWLGDIKSVSLLGEEAVHTIPPSRFREAFGIENKESRLTLEPCHSKPHDLILKSTDILHHEQYSFLTGFL